MKNYIETHEERMKKYDIIDTKLNEELGKDDYNPDNIKNLLSEALGIYLGENKAGK